VVDCTADREVPVRKRRMGCRPGGEHGVVVDDVLSRRHARRLGSKVAPAWKPRETRIRAPSEHDPSAVSHHLNDAGACWCCRRSLPSPPQPVSFPTFDRPAPPAYTKKLWVALAPLASVGPEEMPRSSPPVSGLGAPVIRRPNPPDVSRRWLRPLLDTRRPG
jgi:hypothetical protein